MKIIYSTYFFADYQVIILRDEYDFDYMMKKLMDTYGEYGAEH